MAAVALMGATAAVTSARSGEPSPAGDQVSSPVHAFRLEYRELTSSLMNWGVSFDSASITFKQEPEFGQHTVVRRALKLGQDSTQNLPFAWDKTAGKLYLDLNRNLDLSDDTNGVHAASSKSYYHTFTNVHLPYRSVGGARQVLVDLNLADSVGGPRGYASLKSYWTARVQLGDRSWHAGVIEGYFGSIQASYLVLRPWEQNNETLSVQGGSPAAFDFPRQVFVGGQDYALTARFQSQDNAPGYQLEFKNQSPALGTLKLTGKSLDRILLLGDNRTVVIDAPTAEVPVPAGSYSRQRAWLKQDNTLAYRDLDSTGKPVVVKTNEPTLLATGGPLTNCVAITGRGRSLYLSYRLAGADGAEYHLARQDRTRPPQFAVFQGDRQIASGKFEFG